MKIIVYLPCFLIPILLDFFISPARCSIMIPVLLQSNNGTSANMKDSISYLINFVSQVKDRQDNSVPENGEVNKLVNKSPKSTEATENFLADKEREGFSINVNVTDVAVANKSSSLLKTVQKLYQNFNMSDINKRFHVIMEKIYPNLDVVNHLCPEECQNCTTDFAEILCRICCADQFKQPMSLSSFLHDHFDHLVTWLTSSSAFRGLKAIYNRIIGRARGIGRANEEIFNPKEILTFIRNFHWHELNSVDSKVTNSSFLFNSNKSMETEDICGYFERGESRVDQGRIVGGEVVDKLNMFPWQMSLSSGWAGVFYQHRCGAALISDLWVLTAAHCTHHLGSSDGLYVIGGFLDINNKESAQIRSVDKLIPHENFMPALYENDICLIRMDSPIVYTPSLLPVCLPSPHIAESDDYARMFVGEEATLTGWGRQWHNGPLADQLEMVRLPVVSNEECMRWYNSSGSRQFIPTYTFLCAGYEEGVLDACSGDSGGPLVIDRDDGRIMIWGIVSWGIGCGVAGRPGVYTRVSQVSSAYSDSDSKSSLQFVDWIEDNIRSNTV